MMQFFGGSMEVLVQDNLRSGVSKACYYDPEINPTYEMFARHYGIAILGWLIRKTRQKWNQESRG